MRKSAMRCILWILPLIFPKAGSESEFDLKILSTIRWEKRLRGKRRNIEQRKNQQGWFLADEFQVDGRKGIDIGNRFIS